MGNQAGKQKGEAGEVEPVSPGAGEGSSRGSGRLFGGKGGKSGRSAATEASPKDASKQDPLPVGGASHPIDFGGGVGSGPAAGGGKLLSKSPSSAAMPVPSPSNAPVGFASGKHVPYKRPKGTIEWDSEEEEDGGDESARRGGATTFAAKGADKKVTLADFEPLKVIGNGCFGKVMMVRLRKSDKIYAMKSIRKAHVVKNNKVRHTLAERNIMQKISHPFVMRLHYAFQNNGKVSLSLSLSLSLSIYLYIFVYAHGCVGIRHTSQYVWNV